MSNEIPKVPEFPADRVEEKSSMPEIVLNFARWIVYSVIFFLILLIMQLPMKDTISLALLIGWFGAAMNELITSFKK